MDTEQDVSLAPGGFWDTTLRRKEEDMLDRKFSPQDRPQPEDTVVAVSVNKRAERDLAKEFVRKTLQSSPNVKSCQPYFIIYFATEYKHSTQQWTQNV